MQKKRRITVTSPLLPPLYRYIPYLADIWRRRWLTNNGYYCLKLEKALEAYLQVPYVCLVSNGTMALVAALKALDIKGEVITTPFSFVATSHVLSALGITPVFIDIDPETCNLDPQKIEAAITPRTSAILPVHTYGNPCDTAQIEKIAQKHKLKVIYDAAHAFGVKTDGGSLLNEGDLSCISFHATKAFSTVEGGAVICKDEETFQKLKEFRNFGIINETSIKSFGLNLKIDELRSAFGLLCLKYIDKSIKKRRRIIEYYQQELKEVKGISWVASKKSPGCTYFPIFVNPELYGESRDMLYERMKLQDIYARRYFYPLISNTETYRDLPSAQPGNLPVASRIAEEVLCLPLHPYLSKGDLQRIIHAIKSKV